jgi:hypothetical protein
MLFQGSLTALREHARAMFPALGLGDDAMSLRVIFVAMVRAAVQDRG